MKKIFFVLILLVINACDEENPTENIIIPPVDKDTLSREIIEDVFLFVDSLKDVYTLDEYILGRVHLINENNPEGLPIFIGNYPPYLAWRVKNSEGNIISGGPSIVGGEELRDTLWIGEEIISNVQWYQHMHDDYEIVNGLKAFTGDYSLEINFIGIDYKNYPHLIKYFRISEAGDPLAYHSFRDYHSEDSVKFDFVLRNRINNTIVLNPSTDSCAIFIIKGSNHQEPDTVFTRKFVLEDSVYNLQPLSDNILYKFRYLKQDFINQGITGGFYFVIKLNFKERILIAKNLFFIL